MAEDTGPLSLDAAVSVLDARAPAEEVTEQPIQEQPAANEAESREAVQDEQPGEAQTEVGETPVATVRNPPPHWSADDFSKAPPEVQDIILRQEGQREAVVQRMKQEAADSRKSFDTQKAELDR